MACALDVSKMRSDLNKLNKDVLIDIIVNRSIPDRISVSDNMRKYIKNQFEEKFDEFYDATSSNLKISNEIDQLKCNLKISIVERNALQRLVKELENTTKNQEMLIDLLKENRKSTTAELVEPNHNVATPQGPVMIPGRKSVIGHNKEAGSVSSMKVRTPTRSIRSPSEGGIFQGSSIVTADQSFAGAVRRAWLHVGRVSLGTDAKSIENYLKGKFPSNSFLVEPLPVRENAHSLSFKVSSELSILDDLNKPELWPRGVTIRR
ncbi:hypothetical protein WA026_022866, partial [Henosepilachna vigintioctopunctata]